MSEFTFLTDEQIYGDNQLDIIKKYGTKCAITDFSILLGGRYSEYGKRNLKNGWWWIKTPFKSNPCFVESDGSIDYRTTDTFSYGARPALPYYSICNISSNKVRRGDGTLEVEYGEYPQTIVSGDFAKELERLYSNKKIKQTGKIYTTADFVYQIHPEYEYQGKKYIRIENMVWDDKDGAVLSDGTVTRWCSPHWVEVEPIKWIIDEKANIALSEKILFSGVQFDSEKNYNGDFDKTYIKQFMDEYFSKDIIPYNTSRKVRHDETKEKRKGIKIKKINLEKIKDLATNQEKTLRTEFNGETPNADPRKWEMASKMLKATNNPKMLR